MAGRPLPVQVASICYRGMVFGRHTEGALGADSGNFIDKVLKWPRSLFWQARSRPPRLFALFNSFHKAAGSSLVILLFLPCSYSSINRSANVPTSPSGSHSPKSTFSAVYSSIWTKTLCHSYTIITCFSFSFNKTPPLYAAEPDKHNGASQPEQWPRTRPRRR